MNLQKQLRGKTVAVVAGGKLDTGMLQKIAKADYRVGVDRGAIAVLKKKLPLHLAIGDFDSVTPTEKQRIHNAADIYMEYQPEKDMTDLELAIREVCARGPKKVVLFAVLGKRFDHTMGAIQSLIYLSSHNIDGEIVDNFNRINIVRRLLTIERTTEFRYVSVLPLGKTATVSMHGFAYNVSRKPFRQSSTLGISNEIVAAKGIVTVHQGSVLVVQSRD